MSQLTPTICFGPRFKIIVYAFLILPFLVTGCSGRSGFLSSEDLPASRGNKKALAIPLFSNTTSEPLLERELTRIFKETFYGLGWNVKNKPKDDGATLLVRITGFSQKPTVLTPTGGAREYQITINMAVRLLEGEEETFSRTVGGLAEYITRSDTKTDRISKDRAIREAGRKMAEKVSAFLQFPSDNPPQVATE